MNEIRKPIQGYEGYYEVSNLGRVRSLDRYVESKIGQKMFFGGKSKNVRLMPNGKYKIVDLRKDGSKKTFYIHRLVALHFVSGFSKELEVLHGEKGSLVNTVENLSWGTRSQNNFDKQRDGTDHKRNKKVCPRNHLLESPNLRAADQKKGIRNCLACDRAKSHISFKKKTSNQKFDENDLLIISNEKYKIIMGGNL